jgi:hypothetical protein
MFFLLRRPLVFNLFCSSNQYRILYAWTDNENSITTWKLDALLVNRLDVCNIFSRGKFQCPKCISKYQTHWIDPRIAAGKYLTHKTGHMLLLIMERWKDPVEILVPLPKAARCSHLWQRKIIVDMCVVVLINSKDLSRIELCHLSQLYHELSFCTDQAIWAYIATMMTL